ncbi:ABC transporter permease [Acetitomaculum ruminis]|uniref:ABC transporter permease n=1 Tax=Acetitomaculum ruminis TaxID=2382 RepID=UPI0015A5B9CD|nr:ABC transporter permease [Acetitomaculum ruminis]
MNNKLLIRLIKNSMAKSRHTRIPFVIVSILTMMTFYIISSMAFSDFFIKDEKEVFYGAGHIISILMIGSIIIAIIAAVIILYANAFIMRDKRREIGLYGILGLTKKNINLMLLYESSFYLIISLAFSIIAGTFLNKLMVMVLYKLTNQQPVEGMVYSTKSVIMTCILATVIYGIALIYNICSIQLSKPVELLRSNKAGEKEPKIKFLILIIGLISLIAGYYIAINCENTIDSLFFFFLAVFLVVLATYCLFTAGSIAILKWIKNNKKLYYKTNNFIGVGNLMYRMKHNAVGLASICVLSTAVIILISSVFSLSALGKRSIENRCPKDIIFRYTTENEESGKKFENAVKQLKGLDIKDIETRALWSSEWGFYEGDEIGYFRYLSDDDRYNMSVWRNVYIILEDSYNKFAKEPIKLKKDEVGVIDSQKNKYTHLTCGNNTYKAMGDLEYKTLSLFRDSTMDLFTSVYIVVPDKKTAISLLKNDPSIPENLKSSMQYISSFNLKERMSEDEISQIKALLSSLCDNDDYSIIIKQEDTQFFISLYGGVLFVGIFLAIIFLMVTVLIIYYKQMSEGYQDKSRYEIMKKVGLTEKEVKSSINRQVMIMFFMPIIAAGIHTVVASSIIRLFLGMILYVDAFTFNITIFSSIAVFALVYCLVYRITSRQYYEIVNR